MSIISQETWDSMSNKEKEKLRSDYDDLVYLSEHGTDEFIKTESLKTKKEYERLFGKENLQPKPNIKTWKDLEKEHPEYFKSHNTPNPKFIPSQELRDKLFNKTMAMYKIVTLIEFGYGGMITEKEWNLSSSYAPETRIWSIVCYYRAESKDPQLKIVQVWAQPHLLSFHTKEQAEEFISYNENVELIKQYYMI